MAKYDEMRITNQLIADLMKRPDVETETLKELNKRIGQKCVDNLSVMKRALRYLGLNDQLHLLITHGHKKAHDYIDYVYDLMTVEQLSFVCSENRLYDREKCCSHLKIMTALYYGNKDLFFDLIENYPKSAIVIISPLKRFCTKDQIDKIISNNYAENIVKYAYDFVDDDYINVKCFNSYCLLDILKNCKERLSKTTISRLKEDKDSRYRLIHAYSEVFSFEEKVKYLSEDKGNNIGVFSDKELECLYDRLKQQGANMDSSYMQKINTEIDNRNTAHKKEWYVESVVYMPRKPCKLLTMIKRMINKLIKE